MLLLFVVVVVVVVFIVVIVVIFRGSYFIFPSNELDCPTVSVTINNYILMM